MRISYSQLGAFNRCRQYWKQRYLDKNDIPDDGSDDLSWGSAYHDALALYFTGERDLTRLCDEALKTKMHKKLQETMVLSLENYVKHWQEHDNDWIPLAVEEKHVIQVNGIDVAVIFDALLQDNYGKICLMEHKTTRTPDIMSDSMWLTRKQTDLQTRLYAWAAGKKGWKIDHVCYNVIRRPIYKIDGKNAKTVPKEREKFFQRHVMTYTEEELLQSITGVMEQHQIMNYCQSHGLFDKNGQACHDFGRSCEYMEQCWGSDVVKVTKKPWK